jgi:4-nitrophenyl phosphatase
MNFTDIRGVVLDMDGVLWRGNDALPGMGELFAFLRGRGVPFALATNNSSTSPADYVRKLEQLGVTGVDVGQIVTSATTTVDYMQGRYAPGTEVYVLGVQGLKDMIAAGGFTVVEAGKPPVVVSGASFDLTYEKLKIAALAIRAGADFIGTNDDATYPTPEGLAPGAGSILAALKTASGREPVVMGKPDAPMFVASMHTLGTDAAHTLMIGDRLNTDIAGAQAVGMKAALVLTGVSTRDDIELTGVRPDAIYTGLPELLAAWSAA